MMAMGHFAVSRSLRRRNAVDACGHCVESVATRVATSRIAVSFFASLRVCARNYSKVKSLKVTTGQAPRF